MLTCPQSPEQGRALRMARWWSLPRLASPLRSRATGPTQVWPPGMGEPGLPFPPNQGWGARPQGAWQAAPGRGPNFPRAPPSILHLLPRPGERKLRREAGGAGAGRAPGTVPGRRRAGLLRPRARPVQSGARGRGGAAGSTAPRGRGGGGGRRARGGLPERRPGRSGGPHALPGPGHDPRCSLLQTRRPGPRSPATAAASTRAGPVHPGRGSAVSPPGSGECPVPLAPRCLAPRCPSTPSRARRAPREPQPTKRRPRPTGFGGGKGAPLEARGFRGAVADPRGPGRPPNFSQAFLRGGGFGESWAQSSSWAVLQLTPGGWGCVRA